MTHRCWRIILAITIAPAFIGFCVYGATLPTSSYRALGADPHRSVALVAKQSKKSRSSSSPISVSNIRFHAHKTYTRVVLDLPRQLTASEFKDPKHQRTTIQLKSARLSPTARKRLTHRDFPPGIKIKERSNQTVSVILDLTLVDKYRLNTLQRPSRFIVDLYYSPMAKPSSASINEAQSPKTRIPQQETQSEETQRPSSIPLEKLALVASAQSGKGQPNNLDSNPTAVAVPNPVKLFKELLVVIDPGHGGKDPGAIGAKGTREKEITLSIAQVLQDIIQRRLGTRVLLTRSTDVFLDLEDRVAFANNQKADVFISIHVNSHPIKSIKGLEVYHFGKASDPRALQVAARENGITLADDAPPWQFIIVDKLNDQKIEESQTFAWTTRETLLDTLKKKFTVKDHGVKTAPFYVLRFTTMPSILAEVAFVSNPAEENRLRTKSYQKSLAEGMYKGIHAYLKTLHPKIS